MAPAGVAGALVGLLFVAVSVTQERLAPPQLIYGISIIGSHDDVADVRAIAIVVIMSFLIGIARAWELIGDPEIGLLHELRLLGRHEPADEDVAGGGRSAK